MVEYKIDNVREFWYLRCRFFVIVIGEIVYLSLFCFRFFFWKFNGIVILFWNVIFRIIVLNV